MSSPLVAVGGLFPCWYLTDAVQISTCDNKITNLQVSNSFFDQFAWQTEKYKKRKQNERLNFVTSLCFLKDLLLFSILLQSN